MICMKTNNKNLLKMKKILFLLTLIITVIISVQNIDAQISGTVFQDGNGDGVFQSSEPKVGGVTINAYDASGNLCGSAVSVPNASPNYTINGCSGAVRLEFIIPDPSACGLDNTLDFPTALGSNSKTSVQFTTDGTSNNDFGIMSNDFYVRNDNPTMFVTNYINGTGQYGTTSDQEALVSFLYKNSGVPASQGGSAPDPVIIAKTHQIGSVWGLAYSKQAKRLFAAAILKRHVGMGPDGPGAIYMIDPNNPPAPSTVPSFINLDALGIATSGSGSYSATHPGFSDVIGTNQERGLPDNKEDPSADPSAFGQVGKVSLGDIDLSDDGRYLYVINLYDRKLYQIDLQNPENPVVPTISNVKAYDMAPWLTQSCNNGVARPFGLKYYRGNIYVGVVCTGENNSYNGAPRRFADDLRAFVYKVDPAGNGSGANIEIEFPLNYDKESSGAGDGAPTHGWYVWTDDWSDFENPFYEEPYTGVSHPQPILGDIEIDADGSFILSFMDRGGHQGGLKNYDPYGNKHDGHMISYVVGGDILKTYRDPSTCEYVLEANGSVGPYTSTAEAPRLYNNEYTCTGPSTPNGTGASFTGYYQSGNSGALVGNDQYGAGKEFYWGDYANVLGHYYPEPHHGEGTVGGAAILPSSGEVMVVAMDPVDGKLWSGGVYSLDNSTGARNNGYNIYTDAGSLSSGKFGKAAGLGDVEIVGEIPPIEIGNRVWDDTDGDGIQDPGEAGISGVQVQLLQNGTVIATATTDADGNYIFSNDESKTSTSSHIYGIAALQPNTDYMIKVPTTNGTKNLTAANIGNGDNPDLNDSDAIPSSGEIAVPASTIPITGANNHNYDIGYTAQCSLTDAGKSDEQCNDNGTSTDSSDDYISFSLNPQGSNLSASGYTVSVNNSGSITPQTANYGNPTTFRLQDGSANGTTYTITITDNDDPNCTITTTVSQNSCSVPPACSVSETHSTQCHDNGTQGDETDDYFDLTVTGTIANGSGNYVVIIGSYTSATTQSGSSVTIVGDGQGGNPSLAADGSSTYTVRVQDANDASCYTEFTVGPVSSCSNCPPQNCGTVTIEKN